MCDALTESFVNGKITEMTESESVHYQSTIINHVDSVTIRGKGMLRERSRVKISKELRGHILMILLKFKKLLKVNSNVTRST